MTLLNGLAALTLLASFCLSASVSAAADPIVAGPWIDAESSRVRLVGGRIGKEGASQRLVAGLEIEMEEGWKTYWRNPGSSGVPPRLDWSKSTNLADARLLFPAPVRFVDRDGDTIGYKGAVVLPIELTPQDASKPVALALSAEYGICKDICIPVELNLTLSVPANAATVPGDARLAQAFGRVPRPTSERAATDPAVARIEAELAGARPRILVEASFPKGTKGADLFVEAPDGLWVPLPRKTATAADGTVAFQIDLTDGVDIAELKGKTLRLTLVSDAGQSEAVYKVE